MLRKLIFTFTFCIFNFLLFGQNRVLGIVIDKNGVPIIDVVITDFEKTEVTYTDEDGDFEFYTNDSELIISHLGYKPMKIKVVLGKKMTIILKANNELTTISPIQIITKNVIYEEENVTVLPTSIKDLTTPASTASILNLVPGIHMQSGGLNTNKITVRGVGAKSQFATTDLKTFYNNIPLHSSVGESAIEDFGFHMAENIKIIKGTTGPKYESGYGGAIMINNKVIKSQNKTEFSTHITGGKWQHLSTQNKIKLFRSDSIASHNISLYHTYLSDQGYRFNNQFNRNNLTLNYSLDLRGKFRITTLLNWVELRANIPSSLDKSTYLESPRSVPFNWSMARGNERYQKGLVGINIDFVFNDKVSFSNTIYGQFFGGTEIRPFNTIDERLNSYGIKGNLEYKRHQYNEIYSLGYRLQKEEYDFTLFDTDGTQIANLISLGDNRISRIAEIYGEIKSEINHNWSYYLGLNLQYTNIDVQDFNVLNKVFLLPEIRFTYKSKNNARLYISGGRGINYIDPYQAVLPNGAYSNSLTPSFAWNFTLGSKGILFNSVEYRAEIYRMWVENILSSTRDINNQPINESSGTASYSGLELSVKSNIFRTNKNPNKAIELELQYQLMQNVYEDFNNNNIDFGGNTIPGSPPQTFTGIISGKYYGLFGNIRFQFVDAYHMRDDNSIKSDLYQLINTTIGYRFIAGKWTISPRFDIANLLNEKYASMTLVNASSFGGNPPRYYYPGRPRNAMASLKIEYKL